MRKWIVVRNITLTILVIFIFLVFAIGLGFITDTATYPDAAWGLTRLESFGMVTGFILIVSGIPLLIDIILLIISVIMIKRGKR